jgi:hypothetical protein
MKTKIAVALLLLAVLVTGAFYMLGIRLRMGENNSNLQNTGADKPLGVVRLLDASSNKILKSTDLMAYNQIYRALGVTNDKLVQWENENGYWSLGRDKAGQFLIPGFPIFSKVAWMYIEPVDLSLEEIAQLAQECAKAENSTDDAVTKEELNRIRALAEEAVSQSAIIRFDHP